ncbi:type I-MYXAN CRISPR-associated Cas8a1/Cmx1 [Rosistilla oblonga]|uniref:type I-MYXAN CRISPR-associated Cas8a1/Cmx1 n=1 Tax=Rosistilla oblonga TaxID=2527990 RepID=UPI003A980A9D
MATKTKAKKKTTSPLPDHLEVSLSDPAMDVLLRAGIGGLATTLKEFELEVQCGKIDDLPDGYWNGDPPWEITSSKIIFRFHDPAKVAEYFEPIFQFAFQIHAAERVINLRPVFQLSAGNTALLAQLQRGLMLTFLQHGKSRKGAKKDEVRSIEIDGKPHQYSVRALDWFKHQDGYLDLIDKRTQGLSLKPQEIPGTLYPGAAVRHNAFAGHTKQEGNAAQLLAAYFAPIGTLALPVNRGAAVLLVPEVHDLKAFASKRPMLTPRNYQDCLISGTGDAVLQLYTRIRGEDVQGHLAVDAIHAYLFQPTAWASQQKSRVASERIEPLPDREFFIFRFASDFFQPKRRSRTIREKAKRGEKAVERTEYFWSTSIIRPMIAKNLASGAPWFHDFHRLFVDRDPANGKPYRDRLFFEREGLIQMVQSDVWDDNGQQTLVRAVHHALRGRYGQIAKENEGSPVAMRNRFRGEYDRWRLAFSGAKTADQFRNSICDLLSRVPANKELQKHWTDVLPLLDTSGWQHARDLALLAMASYQGNGDKELTPGETDDS